MATVMRALSRPPLALNPKSKTLGRSSAKACRATETRQLDIRSLGLMQ